MAAHLTPLRSAAPETPGPETAGPETAGPESAGPESAPLLKLLDDVHHHIVQRVCVAVGGSATLDEWAVLAVLSDRAGHSMRQIADSTHTPPPTMTKLITRLVAGGLVYRRTDPIDRRRVYVFISARGRSRYRRLRSLVETSIASLADDQQLRELIGELQRRIDPNPRSSDQTQPETTENIAVGRSSQLH